MARRKKLPPLYVKRGGRWRIGAGRKDSSGRKPGNFADVSRVAAWRDRREAKAAKVRAFRAVDRRRMTSGARQSERMKVTHEIARTFIKHEPDLPYRAAFRMAAKSVPRALGKAHARVFKDWIGQKPRRSGLFREWKNEITGEVRSAGDMRRAATMALYRQSVWQLARWKGISYTAARRIVTDEYGGDWREALDEESPSKE